MAWESHVCTVCLKLDDDDTLKLCLYCSRCDAWICEKDMTRWDRRARAAIDRVAERAAR